MKKIEIIDFQTISGEKYPKIELQYQVFGQELGKAPIVLVNHALTGNSQVTGENGWWNEAVGNNKPIDNQRFTIICFDIPGNGFQNTNFIEKYENWTARDVARIFLEGIDFLKISSIEAIVGNSVGGGIAWEMIALSPTLFKKFIAVATDWKSTDWVIANSLIQERILASSPTPLHDARMHAMLYYRTPNSLKIKFERSKNPNKPPLFNIETWLLHHGEKLEKRFSLQAYKLMNQLVKTIDITRERGSFEEVMAPVTTHFHIIGTDSDIYFVPEENRLTHQKLQQMGKPTSYYELTSVHGHDAFLIEYEQLDTILRKIL